MLARGGPRGARLAGSGNLVARLRTGIVERLGYQLGNAAPFTDCIDPRLLRVVRPFASLGGGQPPALGPEVIGHHALRRAIRPTIRTQPVVEEPELGAEAWETGVTHHVLVVSNTENGARICGSVGPGLFRVKNIGERTLADQIKRFIQEAKSIEVDKIS